MNKIEKYYKEAFSNFEYKVSGSFWRKLKWRLLWIDLKYYIAGGTLLAFTGLAFYFGLAHQENLPATDAFSGQYNTVNYQTNVIQLLASNENLPSYNTLIAKQTVIPDKTLKSEISKTNQIKTTNNNSAVSTESANSPVISATTENAQENETDYLLSEIDAVSIAFDGNGDSGPKLIYDSTTNLFIPNKKTSISMAFFVSPAYNIPEMSATSVYNENLEYKKTHEKASVSLSAGVDFQLNLKNWYLQTGLSYSKFSNNRNYNHTFLAYDSLRSYYENDTTWGWVYDPPDFGKPVPIAIDSVLVAVYNDINEGKNEWNYLEIPLLVGYKLNKGRFSFDLATGVSYGLLINTSGNVPSTAEKNIFTELSEMNSLMNRNQFNYILQIGVSYHITPVWSIMAKPYYKQNLQSVFDKSYPVDQRFRALGMKFGLIVNW
jgi:hypothetical protein